MLAGTLFIFTVFQLMLGRSAVRGISLIPHSFATAKRARALETVRASPAWKVHTGFYRLWNYRYTGEAASPLQVFVVKEILEPRLANQLSCNKLQNH